MNALTDKLFVDWKKGLKPKTASTYGGGVLKFCEYTGKTPSELINEARDDYINRVAPWEIRHVKAILKKSYVQSRKIISNLKAT